VADKYTRSAKGQVCQVRIPGICNADTATTVLAHLNGAGLSIKHLPIHGAYACSACHDEVDGRTRNGVFRSHALQRIHLEGVIRTQILMVENGILVL
jgi:hypothetical protein